MGRLALAVFVAAAALASPAMAVTMFTADFTAASKHTIYFNGLVEGTSLDANLKSRLDLELLTSPTNPAGVFDFKYTLTNVSSGKQAGSRVSAFGFASNPAIIGGSVLTGGTSGFDKLHIQGATINKADFPKFTAIDLCLTDGNNCQGGQNGGATLSQAYTGTFRLLADGPGPLAFTDFAVRYQSLDKGKSGIGLGMTGESELRVVPPVPEPAQWGLLIAGFGLVGAALRRRPPAQRLAA